MANIHGKNAVLYLGAGGAAAIKIGELVDWSLDMDIAMAEVSPLNNTWKEFVKGMLGYSATFNGNFNTAQTQVFTASISDVAEKWYLYPTAATPAQYYYGTAWVQLGKIASGSTSAKASSGFKMQGQDALNANP